MPVKIMYLITAWATLLYLMFRHLWKCKTSRVVWSAAQEGREGKAAKERERAIASAGVSASRQH